MLRERTRKPKALTPEYLTEDSEVNVDNYLYFVGIDPSYSSTGLVVLDNHNNKPLVAKTIRAGKPHEKFYDRIKNLLDNLDAVMIQYPIEDVHVVMEGAAFASEFGAFKLGKLSGALEYYLGSKGFSYNLVAPTYAKKVATGNGAAGKPQVMKGVAARWGFTSASNDICDAYTMAQIARGARPDIEKKPQRKATKKP